LSPPTTAAADDSFSSSLRRATDAAVVVLVVTAILLVVKGFSGREISKLAIAWQAAAYGTPDARFTPELMADVLESYVDQRSIMKAWELQASGGAPPPLAAI